MVSFTKTKQDSVFFTPTFILLVDSDTTLRQRGVQKGSAGPVDSGDVDTVIRHHAEMQERIADEMLQLARNLKENAKASGQIVREDNKVSHMIRFKGIFFKNQNTLMNFFVSVVIIVSKTQH